MMKPIKYIEHIQAAFYLGFYSVCIFIYANAGFIVVLLLLGNGEKFNNGNDTHIYWLFPPLGSLIVYALGSRIYALVQARLKRDLLILSATFAYSILSASSIKALILLEPYIYTSNVMRNCIFPFWAGWTVTTLMFLAYTLVSLSQIGIPLIADDHKENDKEEINSLNEEKSLIDPSTTSLIQALERVLLTPEDARALATAAAFLDHAKDPRAFDYYQKLLCKELKSEVRLRMIDAYLTRALESDLIKTFAEEADTLSRELVSSRPGSITEMGTRGSVLIDLGYLEEGMALLKEVLKRTPSPFDELYSNVFMALAEKQLGNMELAGQYALAAFKQYSDHSVINRISDLIPEPIIFERTEPQA